MTTTGPVAGFQALAITGLPEIESGDDLAGILSASFQFENADVVVIAQKIISKAEGRVVALADVRPTPEAMNLAVRSEKDPRLVQLILDESQEILRTRPGTIIVRDIRGWVCANAGIDRSNVPCTEGEERVSLLPEDPDASAAQLRSGLRARTGHNVGVIVADSHGRAWRQGTVGVAIGAAGVTPLDDRRGVSDREGYVLQHSVIGVVDELAAGGSLLMGQADESIPAVVIRGLAVMGEGSAKQVQRPLEMDLFR